MLLQPDGFGEATAKGRTIEIKRSAAKKRVIRDIMSVGFTKGTAQSQEKIENKGLLSEVVLYTCGFIGRSFVDKRT